MAEAEAAAAAAATAAVAAAAPVARLRYCLVLEYMDEGSLLQRLRNQRTPNPRTGLVPPQLTAQQRFEVASDVARGLEFLHTVPSPPIIHQDIKSDNILLSLINGQLIAKIADFGVARKRKELLHGTHASTVNITGSTPYMPLEFLVSGHVSEKTDAYAFGVVLCELLTGKPPITSESAPQQQQEQQGDGDGEGAGEHELLSQFMLPVLAEQHIEQRLPAMLDPVCAEQWDMENENPPAQKSLLKLKKRKPPPPPTPHPRVGHARALTLGRMAYRCLNPRVRARAAVRSVRPELDALAGREVLPELVS